MSNVKSFEVNIGGAIVYWNLSGDFDHSTLKDGLSTLGLSKSVPETRTHTAALKEALCKAVRDEHLENVLVRGLEKPSEDGFVVVKEELGSDENEYETLHHVVFDTISGRLHQKPENDFADAVRSQFYRCLASVSAYATSKSLVQIACHLEGVPLRQAGGIYWLPEHKIESWRHVAQVVEKSAIGSAKFYEIKTVLDTNSIEAIRDAVTNSISADCERLCRYAETPNAKERFLTARKRDAEELREKVKRWEQVLGLTLDDLRNTASECEKHVVEVGLQQFPNLFNADELASLSAFAPASELIGVD